MNARTFRQTHWRLDDLLPEHRGAAFDEILSDLESAVSGTESQRNLLTPDIDVETFLHILARIKEVRAVATRLGAYGMLWFASDTQSSEALNYQNQIDQRLSEVQNRLLFFSLSSWQTSDWNGQKTQDVMPPSTIRTWPLTKDEARDARKTTGPASSTGVAQRLSGVRSAIIA